MKYPDKFDIIIIGGGPSGCCAALRLLGLGYQVALIEQEIFPRKQIGESLSPGIRNIFNYIQADHLLDKAVYLNNLPSRVIWQTKNEEFPSFEKSGMGIMVDRGTLDYELLILAVKRGLFLFQPATFLSCDKKENDWQIKLNFINQQVELKSSLIIDARGRKGIKSQQRLLTAPPSIALWFEIDSDLMRSEVIVEAVEKGWLWGSPLPYDKFRIMAFVDPDNLKTSRPEILLNQLISQSSLFKPVLEKIQQSNIKSCIALTYTHIKPWEHNYLKVGESAFSLDPLSSTGVEKAMRFSLQAVIAINTILKTGNQQLAQTFYEDRILESVVNHHIWTKNYYAEAWPGNNYPFWRERSKPFLEANPEENDFYQKLLVKISETSRPFVKPAEDKFDREKVLNNLWYKKYKISNKLTYMEKPCVVGEYLELKTTVKHPSLQREVAYLEQMEIKTLLDIASEVDSFGDLIYSLNNIMEFEQACRLAIYLWKKEILI